MTNEKAIKYLKQLYPNGGHCWLDEQRIEAIGMAIKALQKEPVSEELEEAVNAYIGYVPEVDESSSTYGKRQAFKAGANWKEQQLMAKAVDARCFGFQGAALFSFRLPAKDYLVGSKIKVIIIKED